MRLRLTPRDTSFYDHFTDSARNIVEAAEVLCASLRTAPTARRSTPAVRDIEHANDEITHEVMRRLNSTFVTPFDREDIYDLASRLDDVMDYLEAAADLIVLYELDGAAARSDPRGRQLLRAGRPRHRRRDAAAAGHSRTCRSTGSRSTASRTRPTSSTGARSPRCSTAATTPCTALKLKDVVDQVEAAADAFEDVADTVETIAVKES